MADVGLSVSVGQKVTFSKQVTDQDIRDFARVSGDVQPIHLDEAYATRTRFGHRVAHGVLTLSIVSAALGTKLAGPNESVVYLSQNLRFTRPVFVNDTITASLEVTAVDPERRRVTVSTTCVNQRDEQLMTGEAVVLLDAYPYVAP
ncbi:MAG: MaoC family dehydratase [Chloroflexi bacterium]|nr:MaoC family dehydratase [Chloroflexota bacterium]